MLNVFDGEEAALELFEWEDLVSRLDSFVAAAGSGARKVAELPSSASVLRRGNRYDVASIVGTLASAMQLRDRHDLSHLRRIVQQTTSVIFPECDFDESVWQKIPSGPTLSRAQLLVDAAFCCFTRDRYAQQKFRMYLLADSSPQAGEDYLLSTALMIASHDLERCFVAASHMRSSWDEVLDAYKQEDREKLSNIALLRDEYGEVVHGFAPLSANGLGVRRLWFGAQNTALARAMFAETQTIPALREWLSQVVSMTSDMGTEMGIANLAGFYTEGDPAQLGCGFRAGAGWRA